MSLSLTIWKLYHVIYKSSSEKVDDVEKLKICKWVGFGFVIFKMELQRWRPRSTPLLKEVMEYTLKVKDVSLDARMELS